MDPNLADTTAHLQQSFSGLVQVLGAVAYLGGAGFGIKAALALKQHSDNPQRYPASPALAFMVVAGLLLSLPTFMTVGMGVLGGSQVAQATAAPAPAVAAVDSAPSETQAVSKGEVAKVVAAEVRAALAKQKLDMEAAARQRDIDEPALAALKAPAQPESRALLEAFLGLGAVGLVGGGLLLRASRGAKARQASTVEADLKAALEASPTAGSDLFSEKLSNPSR